VRRILRAALALAILAAARPAAAGDGYIREWLLLGSFPRDDAATRLSAPGLPDESAVAPKPGDPAEGFAWKAFTASDATADLASNAVGFSYRTNAVAYAFAYVHCPADRTAALRLAGTGGLAAWVNGERVWFNEGGGAGETDPDVVPVRLFAGWNLLLLKTSQGTGPWTFAAGITDDDGKAIPGLRVMTRTTGANTPAADPGHGLQATSYTFAPPAAGADGRPGYVLSVNVRNLSPAATAAATAALGAGPGSALPGASPQEIGAFAPWERKTIRFALALEDLLALARAAKPGVELLAAGTARYASPDDGLIPALFHVTLAPVQVSAWRVLPRDEAGAEQVSFPADPKLAILAPGQEIPPEGPAVWLRTRLAVPAPLNGVPLALETGRAGNRMEIYVNGVRKEDGKGEPVPLTPVAQEYVVALKVEPEGTRPVRLPAASFALADPAARYVSRNVELVEALFPDARAAIRDGGVRTLAALAEGGAAAFQAALARIADDVLRVRARQLKDYTVWYVGRSHIDLSGLWRRDEAVRMAMDTLTQASQFIAENPRFTYAQDQAAAYTLVEQQNPELFARIRKAVEEKRWSPVGGMWVDPDLILPSGESLVRQLLAGKRYFLRKFGVDVRIGWSSDVAGHCAQLPQLLKKSGIDSYALARGRDTRRLFVWEGLDGSRVLCANALPRPPSADIVNDLREGGRLAKVFLVPYGADGHGGGPSRDDLRRIDELRAREVFPTADFGTPEQFFPLVERAAPGLPTVSGDLPGGNAGSWTSRSGIKRGNRRGESLLAAAEAAAAVAHDAGRPYDRVALDAAWRTLLFNQFHHTLGGAAVHDAALDAERDLEAVAASAEQVLQNALDALAARARTDGDGIPVVVYNPLPWTRTDVADVDVIYEGSLKSLAVVDPASAEVPSQPQPRLTGAVRILFLARDVPPCGFRVYRVRDAGDKGRKAFRDVEVAKDGSRIETDRWLLEIDPSSGCIVNLVDKAAQTKAVVPSPALAAGRNGDAKPQGGNLLQLFGDRGADSSRVITYTGERWNLDRGAKVRVMEAGPVRAVVRITRTFKDERPDYSFGPVSTFQQDLVVYRDLDRIDLVHEIDWQERYKILKLAFPAGVGAGATAAAEVPYGAQVRPADGADRPAQTWADLSDGRYGLAVLNTGQAGFDADGTVLRVHLLRGAFDADPESDRGRHRFTIALLPHAGDWRQAALPRRGRELNRPLAVRTTRPHAGPLDAEAGFVAVEPANVIADAVKRAEDSDDLVVRIAETHGAKGTAARVLLWRDPAKATGTDLLERGGTAIPTAGRTIAVPLGPFEIKTIRIEMP
jgi:alpha-mannosidase